MKKETVNLLIRLVAGIAASLILVGAIGLMGNGMSKGKDTEGLFYQITMLHPDGELLNVDGESISVEEFLYRLYYECLRLSTYIPDIDLSEQTAEGGTYGDSVKGATLEKVRLYAVIRKLARDTGLTMTEDDLAKIDELRKGYIDYYGDEETYFKQLSLLGISEETFLRINETQFLYQHLKDAYTRPDYFDDWLLEACAAADVTVNEKLYDAIDPVTFYPALLAAQEEMTRQLKSRD